MGKIHVIARERAGLSVDSISGEAASGDWAISDETANALIDGEIYLHDTQEGPSYYGGKIIRVDRKGGRKVIIFKPKKECKNIKTDKEGWSQEKKIIP